jgi:plasmid stability protein
MPGRDGACGSKSGCARGASCCGGILDNRAQNEIIAIIDLTEGRMTGNLHVRNLEDDLIVRLKRRAQRHGRSTEAEHREILRQALVGEDESSFEKLAADLRKLTKRRKQTPSELLLREGRKER